MRQPKGMGKRYRGIERKNSLLGDRVFFSSSFIRLYTLLHPLCVQCTQFGFEFVVCNICMNKTENRPHSFPPLSLTRHFSQSLIFEKQYHWYDAQSCSTLL